MYAKQMKSESFFLFLLQLIKYWEAFLPEAKAIS